MKFERKIRFITVVLLMSLVPQAVFARGFKNSESGQEQGSWWSSWGPTVAVGTAGVSVVDTFAVLGQLGLLAGGMTAATTATLVGVGVPLAALAVGGAAYLLHKKYKTQDMGISSEHRAALQALARASQQDPQLFEELYLTKKFDAMCSQQYPGNPSYYDHLKSKTQERKTNLFSGSVLSAYNVQNRKQKYRYFTNYPSLLMKTTWCSSTPGTFSEISSGPAPAKLKSDAQILAEVKAYVQTNYPPVEMQMARNLRVSTNSNKNYNFRGSDDDDSYSPASSPRQTTRPSSSAGLSSGNRSSTRRRSSDLRQAQLRNGFSYFVY